MMRLAGTINGKTGRTPGSSRPTSSCRRTRSGTWSAICPTRRRPPAANRLAGGSRDPYKRISPPDYFEKTATHSTKEIR